MLDNENPDTGAQEAPSKPVRRRRAASRPAGPPAALPASAPAPAELPAGSPAPVELAAAPQRKALENKEPESVEAEVVPTTRRRTTTTRKKAAPAKVEVATEAPSAETPPEPQVEAPTEKPAARTTRRRTTRTTKAATPIAEAETPSEYVAEQAPSEVPAEVTEAVAEAPSAEEKTPARRTRKTATASRATSTRRTTRKAVVNEEAEPETPVVDEVAQSLAALEREAPRRRTRTPKPTIDIATALETLAAAIEENKAEPEEAPEEEVELNVVDEMTAVEEAKASDEAAEETADTDESAEETAEADSDDEHNDEEDSEESSDNEDEPDDEDSASSRRRRRRRGGRRRRRSGSDTEAAEQTETSDESSESDDDSDDDEDKPAEANDNSSSRRRRRRRRRGEEDVDSENEDGVDVVVKVREPRKTKKPDANDQITGIEGSTRMEAKRQRRREGRAAGRRRAPILSEAEFLARRESVERTMVIRQREEYTQIGVLEDGMLVEHYVDRDSGASMIGNIYLGRVQNILPSMEAAFIDIGRGRNAVLYAGEVDWDSFGATGSDRKVENVLKSGQSVLVQVTKDPVGAKGARLTSHISIPGRYVVYSPGGQLSGISRKLPDAERARLKGILDELVGENASVIVRTAAEGASEDELVRDVNRLKTQWEIIEKKVKAGNSPQLLYSEPDLTVRIVRDLFTEDFSKLIVDGHGQGEDAYDTVQGYVTHVAPHLSERLVKWNRWTDGDLFETYRVDEQVAKALERKVHLPSGGSLIIDRTEAMTVIDVNTGRFTGTQGNLEATVTSNNLEAAEEVVRQLRLRDIGGIIVIDFIDMVVPANRELLLRRLVECLGRDRTRHQVAEVTSLGLVQMTRKKIGTGLAEAFTVPCETCKARGYHVHDAPVVTAAPSDGGEREHHHKRRGRNTGNNSSAHKE